FTTLLGLTLVLAIMRHILALLFIVLLSACEQAQRSSSVVCDEPRGVPQAKLLLFGEIHGSVEAPALIGRVACFSALSAPTAIGHENPIGEQGAIDSYLASDGRKEPTGKMLSGPFSQSATDGRSSAAMAELIEYVSALTAK